MRTLRCEVDDEISRGDARTTEHAKADRPLSSRCQAMNAAYVEMMGDHRPARTVFSVKELPKPGVLLTMNLTAVTKRQ
jgi:hypothetical protein